MRNLHGALDGHRGRALLDRVAKVVVSIDADPGHGDE